MSRRRFVYIGRETVIPPTPTVVQYNINDFQLLNEIIVKPLTEPIIDFKFINGVIIKNNN